MKKILVVAPTFSLSGYGDRSRNFLIDLVEANRVYNYEIYLYTLSWGNTLNKPVNIDGVILIDANKTNEYYDVVFDITMLQDAVIHNCGKYVVITAGIESDIHPKINLNNILKNEIDTEVWGSSNHSVSNLTEYNEFKKIVFPETVRLQDVYYTDSVINKLEELENVLLISGAWITSNYGHDRKNIPKTIELVLRSFKDKHINIILHTSMGGYSEIENHTIKTLVKNIKDNVNYNHQNIHPDTKIHIINGYMDSNQMTHLYNLSNLRWCVTMTHGEGFGRHLAEFMLTGGRIVAPNYSGYLDFISESDNILIPCELRNVDKMNVNKYILENSRWAYCDDDIAIEYISKIDFNINRSDKNIESIENMNNFSKNYLINFLKTI